MSAIFGIFNIDKKPVSLAEIEKMSRTLKHRGADDFGVWTNGNIGFGHRMLWTTSESLNEELPKKLDGGKIVITADARIDNITELLDQLGLSNIKAEKSFSDSEVILYAYKKWGEDCPSKLLGDFAFAIWDEAKQRVFCARDHLGVKSFNYYFRNKYFVFATEIKALLCLDRIPQEINEIKIGDYLTSISDDTTSTFYRDIFRLPAAHQMTIDRAGKKISRYWSLDYSREIKLSSNAEYAENFREIFTEAVRCRMRSDFTIGTMLSGGLDSSSVACTARKLMIENAVNLQHQNNEIHTFSAVFEKVAKSDESYYINSVLEQGNFKPHFLKGDEVSPFEDLEKMIWHLDEAIQSGNLYLNWNIYKSAQKNGVRVILDGFDGDSTVSHGQKYLLELALSKRWLTLFNEARGYSKNFDESASALLWAYYWRYGINTWSAKYNFLKPFNKVGKKLYKMALNKDTRPPLSVSEFDDDLNPEFIDRIKLYEHQKSLKNTTIKSPKNEREDHFLKISNGVIPFILETIDKVSAPFNVEVRYPFCDKRLVEFCLALPANQKMHQGYTRVVMRRAMVGILPKEVQWRPGKSNLSHSFNTGLKSFEYNRINKILNTSAGLLNSYLNVNSLEKTHERFSKGVSTDADVLKISSSISLALWLQEAGFTKQ